MPDAKLGRRWKLKPAWTAGQDSVDHSGRYTDHDAAPTKGEWCLCSSTHTHFSAASSETSMPDTQPDATKDTAPPLPWKMGVEIELLTPRGSSRLELAKCLARRFQGQVRPFFHLDQEPSETPGQPAMSCLTPGFEVLDADGRQRVRLVDDSTLRDDLDGQAPPLDGWYKLVADDPRWLRLIARYGDPFEAMDSILEKVGGLLGVVPEACPGEIITLRDDSGAFIALASPLVGERERPCELITPPLARDHGLALEELLDSARQFGCTVPREGATHLHLDASGLRTAATVANLIRLLHPHRALLRVLFSTNPDCRRLAAWPSALVELAADDAFARLPWSEAKERLLATKLDKYCDVNLRNLVYAPRDKDTVEFRMLPTHLEVTPILEAAAVCVAVLRRSSQGPLMPMRAEAEISVAAGARFFSEIGLQGEIAGSLLATLSERAPTPEVSTRSTRAARPHAQPSAQVRASQPALPPTLILTEGLSDPRAAPMVGALLLCCPQNIVGVLDSARQGRCAEEVFGCGGAIPLLGSLDDALRLQPAQLVLGLETASELSARTRETVLAAIAAGLDIVSGLRTPLADDAELRAAAAERDVRLRDLLASAPHPTPYADTWRARQAPVLLTVGTDSDAAMLVSAWQLHRSLTARGLRSAFVASSGAGSLLAGHGLALGRQLCAAVAGAVEAAVDSAVADAQVVVVEGCGSLMQPATSGYNLALLQGSTPDGLVICHTLAAGVDALEHASACLYEATELNLRLANHRKPCSLLGFSLQTRQLPEAAARACLTDLAESFETLVVDPLRFGIEPLTERVVMWLE